MLKQWIQICTLLVVFAFGCAAGSNKVYAFGGSSADATAADPGTTADNTVDPSADGSDPGAIDIASKGTATPVALYRSGNATTPKMDNVRAADITQYTGADRTPWVKAGTGGLSTFSAPSNTKNEWSLPAGSFIPDGIVVTNDHDNHYLFAPTRDMPLSTFVSLLLSISPWTKNNI